MLSMNDVHDMNSFMHAVDYNKEPCNGRGACKSHLSTKSMKLNGANKRQGACGKADGERKHCQVVVCHSHQQPQQRTRRQAKSLPTRRCDSGHWNHLGKTIVIIFSFFLGDSKTRTRHGDGVYSCKQLHPVI
jgi:hypothetical protein